MPQQDQAGESNPSPGLDLSAKTVKQLKEELLARGLSTNGVKSVLVARLEEALAADQPTENPFEVSDTPAAAPVAHSQPVQAEISPAPAQEAQEPVQEPLDPEQQDEAEELELPPNEVAQALGNPHLAEIIHRSQDPALWTEPSSLPSLLGTTKSVLPTRYCRFCHRWVESSKVRTHGSTSSHLDQVLASEKGELPDLDSFKDQLVKAWVELLDESATQGLDSSSPQTTLATAVIMIGSFVSG